MDTYNKIKFETLINEILSASGITHTVTFRLIEDQNSKCYYKNNIGFTDFIENTKYAVIYDGYNQFTLKVGKIENLLKTFITQYCSRLTAYRQDEQGYWGTVLIKKEVFAKIVNANQDRVYKGLFYTTLYGIGFWAIFSTKKDVETAGSLANYLKSNNIEYKNEWSDAGWVYRFKTGKDVLTNNNLLENFQQ